MTEKQKFDETMKKILSVSKEELKRRMEADKKARADVANKEFEARVDKRAKKAAKEMEGHVRYFGDARSKAIAKAATEVFRKKALREVN